MDVVNQTRIHPPGDVASPREGSHSVLTGTPVVLASEWLSTFFSHPLLDNPHVHLTLSQGRDDWDELRPLHKGIFENDPEWLDGVAEAVIQASSEFNVFCCPYPSSMSGERRHKGHASHRLFVHADMDGAVPLGAVRAIGGFAVASGSKTSDGEPRGHVYLKLSESVDVPTHTALCRALGAYLGGTAAGWDDSKVHDNDVLRPCGTQNLKPGSTSVSWMIRPDDADVAVWDPEVLVKQLGAELLREEARAVRKSGLGVERDPDEDRTFTREQAERFVQPKLDDLDNAPPGTRHGRLNHASVIMGHFVGDFWTWDEALDRLRDLTDLPSREFEHTASSGLRAGMNDWVALLVEDDEDEDDEQPGEEDQPSDEDDADVSQEDAPEKKKRSSWHPIDLREVLSGGLRRPQTTMLPRDDGVCLLYPGKTHAINGESESGKSWVAQIEVARLLREGQDVLYLDTDSDEQDVLTRLVIDLDVPAELVIEHLDYRRPESAPSSLRMRDLLSKSYRLIVIDGVTDAVQTWMPKDAPGKRSINDNDYVSAWINRFPKMMAELTGAAVVMLDHVAKGSEGRFAIGAERKLSGITGAAYIAEIMEPLGRGRVGRVLLKVGKDRGGAVRQHAVSDPGGGRIQRIAELLIDGTGEHVRAELLRPSEAPSEDATEAAKEFCVVQVLRGHSWNKSELMDHLKLPQSDVNTALSTLTADGTIVMTREKRAGDRSTKLYYSLANEAAAIALPYGVPPELP